MQDRRKGRELSKSFRRMLWSVLVESRIRLEEKKVYKESKPKGRSSIKLRECEQRKVVLYKSTADDMVQVKGECEK